MNPKTNAQLLNVIAAKNNEIKRLEAASKSRAVDIVELRNEISNLRRWLDTDEEVDAEKDKEIKGLRAGVAELGHVIAAKNNEIKELGREVEELKAIIELAGKINKEFRGL